MYGHFDFASTAFLLHFALKIMLMGWWGERVLNRLFKARGELSANQFFSFKDVSLAALYSHIFFWVACGLLFIVVAVLVGVLLDIGADDGFYESFWSFASKSWPLFAPFFMSYLLRLPNGNTIGYLVGFEITIPAIILDVLKIIAMEAEIWPTWQ